MVIATERIASLTDAVHSFALLRVDLDRGQNAAFSGSRGYLYVLAGKVAVESGTQPRTLGVGEATYVAGGAPAALRNAGAVHAALLHFLLVTPSAGAARYTGAAKVSELHRAAPIPLLESGPYEFSLTRVVSPPKVRPPLHHRSGAAIYYVLEGSATLHTESAMEPRKAGAAQFEPNGFIHTWENSGGVPLVLLQANISREGTPEIIFVR